MGPHNKNQPIWPCYIKRGPGIVQVQPQEWACLASWVSPCWICHNCWLQIWGHLLLTMWIRIFFLQKTDNCIWTPKHLNKPLSTGFQQRQVLHLPGKRSRYCLCQAFHQPVYGPHGVFVRVTAGNELRLNQPSSHWKGQEMERDSWEPASRKCARLCEAGSGLMEAQGRHLLSREPSAELELSFESSVVPDLCPRLGIMWDYNSIRS